MTIVDKWVLGTTNYGATTASRHAERRRGVHIARTLWSILKVELDR